MQIRLASTLQLDSIVDGQGLRMVLWTQGCTHKCYNCHNQETWNLNGGFLEDINNVIKDIKNNLYHDGITLSGGDPLLQIEPILEIVKTIKKETKLNVWCYTGFTYENIIKMSLKEPKYKEFLEYIDVLIDGKFIDKLKSLDLKFKGSSNQRVIDIQATLNNNQVILFEEHISTFSKENSLYI